MKKNVIICLLSIGLLLLVNCSKPKTTPPGSTGNITFLPWEFDVKIDNYQSHFKATGKGSSILIAANGSSLGSKWINFRGSSVLDPDFIAGDLMSGITGSFDESIGNKKIFMQFQLRNSGYFSADSVEIILKDIGKRYEYDYVNGGYKNGRLALIEIPLQKVICSSFVDPVTGVESRNIEKTVVGKFAYTPN